MVTQKQLVVILNAKAAREKIQQEIDILCAELVEKRDALDKRITDDEKKVLDALLAKESVEDGKRCVVLKETAPKSSVSWKGEFQTLWVKTQDMPFNEKEEELKKESLKGKKSTFSVIVK